MKKIMFLLVVALLLVPSLGSAYWADSYQDHQYYVVFDEEGEAAVLATITMQNYDDIENLVLEIPGESFRIIGIVQQYYVYEDDEYWAYDTEYDDVDYTIEELSDSIRLDLTLPQPSEEQITLLVYYKSESYVEKKGTVYSFDFETASSEYDISNVNVYIDVVDDLYLKEGSSETEYKDNFVLGTASMEEVARDSGYYYYSNYQESTSALDPWESFHVTGKYSQTWLDMNWWKIVLGVLGIGMFMIGGVLVFQAVGKTKKRKFSLGLGFGAGSLLIFLWAGGVYAMGQIHDWIGYQYDEMFSVGLVLLLFLISLALFVLPSVFVGIKHGSKEGIMCFVAQLTTIVVLFVIALTGAIIFL
tara:strand:- start:2859 stop:3935 length:1077 start_codon:yes stop_codon:yes gene_type:complete